MTSESQMFLLIRREMLAVLGARVVASDVTADSLLVQDLGFDSFNIVELTMRIEQALGLSEFPMQAWIDQQMENEAPLTVGQLALECEALLQRRRELAT